jgi:hypothetical protein
MQYVLVTGRLAQHVYIGSHKGYGTNTRKLDHTQILVQHLLPGSHSQYVSNTRVFRITSLLRHKHLLIEFKHLARHLAVHTIKTDSTPLLRVHTTPTSQLPTLPIHTLSMAQHLSSDSHLSNGTTHSKAIHTHLLESRIKTIHTSSMLRHHLY